jgi:hypothetical protein
MRENNAQVTATKCAGWELSIRRNAQRADRATRNNKCACITSYSFPAERSSNNLNKWTCCAWKKRSCTTFGNCVDRTVVSSVASSSLWNLKLLDPSIVNLCGSPFGVRTLVDSQAFRVGPPPAARGSYSRGFQVFSSKPLSTSLCTAFQKDTSIIAMQKLKQGQRTHDFLDQPQPLGRGGCMVF